MSNIQRVSAIFDPAWYCLRYPDVAGASASEHYHAVGVAEDRSPCSLFDAAWYREQVGREALGGLAPPDHYLRIGWRLGLDPHPLFSGRWYLACNPDVAAAGIPPLFHYIVRGAEEGRSPHPLFDPQHYAKQAPAAAAAELVSHFLLKGGVAGLEPHALFASGWYLATYPDVAAAGANPLVHYLTVGAAEGRNPSPHFNTLAYLARHPELAKSGTNPLAHFVMAQRGIAEPEAEPDRPDEEIENDPGDAEKNAAPARIVDRSAPRLKVDPGQRRRTRLIAFYLPQFHPIPENDRAWGKGFTEWTNVTRAKPLYPGHKQPLLPSELGFYDLRLDAVRHQQAELARAHGIDAFCYHVYWFDGRRLLEQPMARHLADTTLDFPFCICWANENWTRRWDGMESEIIIGQHHSPRTDRQFIEDMLPYLRDRRYVRVDGRPLVIVYRPELLHDARMTAAIFRDVCRRDGIGEIHLAFVHFHCDRAPAEIGFDAVIEFPPHHFPAPDITKKIMTGDSQFEGGIKDYRAGVAAITAGYKPAQHRRYRGVMPAWDNTARRQSRATVFHGASPDWYEAWLAAAVNCPQPAGSGNDNLVFVNAWNEWAEGAVLEPSQEHGRAYLEATRRVMRGESDDPRVVAIRWSEKHEPLGRTPKARWLIVGHDAARAGSQILLLGMIRELRRRHGIETHLALLEGGDLLAEYELAAPTTVLKQLETAGTRAAALAALEQEAHRLGADLVLANTVVSAKAGQRLARAGFRTVGMVHELVTSIQSRYGADDFRAMVHDFERVLVVSEFARRSLNAAFDTRIGQDSIVRPGVPIPDADDAERAARAARFRRQTGIPADTPIVLGCGHLHARKGPDIFVTLASKVLGHLNGSRRPRFVWVGAGEPALQSWCRHDAEALGIADDVVFLGHLKDAGDAFAAASAFALTSREDPFPLVNLEAMAWGLPVVGFAGAGGAPEALADGAGVVVPYLDLEAMADAIAGWLRNPAAAERVGSTARERAARLYSIEAFTERVLGAMRLSTADALKAARTG